MGVFHTFLHFSTPIASGGLLPSRFVPPSRRGASRRRTAAAAYLAARTRFGIKFGLDTTRALLEELGHPEQACAALLVAGTNGKGSVVAYLDAALRASGLRVGRYVSPHLVSVHERIAVGGQDIAPAAFERAVRGVRLAAERLLRAGRIPGHPTYFEVLTVAAFSHFRAEAVQVAVLEVGMGGRLDATNAVEPAASAIVTLGFDHEAYLGDTLAAIAREKAGVLRAGRTTVLGRLPAEARDAIVAEAAERDAVLLEAAQGVTVRDTSDGIEIQTPQALYRGLRPLPGGHQRDNLVVALRLLETARAAGIRVALETVAAAIATTRWPGRLEWVAGDPPLLLDGAHNPMGAAVLAAHLRALGPFVLLFGAMADKDVGGMARALFPQAADIVLTRPPVSRAATPEEIAARVEGLAARAHLEANLRRALALARRLARGRGPVVVAGSLYLVGAVLGTLRRPRK